MDKIIVNLLGNPIVLVNNKAARFPYRKSEGLFYYVCANKSITRDEAINLLWSDCDEASAKKNLRDAIYKIKKVLSDNIFLSTRKSIISLNIDLVAIDIDSINSSNIDEYYRGDFLSNLSIKDSYEFEEWMLNKRYEYKSLYTKKISSLLNEMVNIKDYNRIQHYSDILISNDPYNEKLYRDIMKIYTLSGEYNKAIKLYFDLSKVLKNDLDIEPELSTKNMYKEILRLKNSELSDEKDSSYFHGRFDEIYNVTDIINNFYNDKGVSIVVSGEAGIGKTAFLNKINEIVDVNKFVCFNTICYQAEEGFFLKPWHSIFNSLGEYIKKEKIIIPSYSEQIISYIFPDFNREISSTKFDTTERIDTTRYRIANEAIVDLLKMLSVKKKTILIFDDIQWMDEMSKMLLNTILYQLSGNGILLICSYRNDYEDKVSRFTVPLISKGILTEIKLSRFTKKEVNEIVFHQLPDIEKKNISLDKIYAETEGNALFLTELIKTIKEKGYTGELSLKATNIIKSRIIDLSKDELSIANAVSIFFDKADIDSIKQMTTYEELEIYDILESLQAKHLITESITDISVYYSFTHQKIRDYVYESQSSGKRKMLHKKAAYSLEAKYNSNNDSSLFSHLIYHFEKSGEKLKTLKYKAEYFKELYTVYHETFPIISYDFSYNNFSYSVDEDSLLELSGQIDELENPDDNDALKIKMEINYITGRFYIARGEYDKGLNCINKSLIISERLYDKNYLLLSYMQMIFYCIQINNLDMMKEYIDKIVAIVGLDEYSEEVGTVLRLYGLYYIKTKCYTKASELLFKSIDIFTSLNSISDKYSLSIAAGYNYLGQMCKYTQNYETAYDYFKKAIEICNKNYITNGLGIFFANAGQVLYELDRPDEADKYLTDSISYFQRNNAIWGRDIAECYKALIEQKRGNKEEALYHLSIAKQIGNKLGNPNTLSLIKKIEHGIN